MLIFGVLLLLIICATGAMLCFEAPRTAIVSATIGIATIIWTIASVATEEPLPIIHDTRTYGIASLADGNYSNTEGEITIHRYGGHGYIKTTPSGYLSYYQKEGDMYTLQTIDANRATILYTDDAPKVVIDKQYCEGAEDKQWVWWFFPRFGFCRADMNEYYTFYIPRDSITQDFNL